MNWGKGITVALILFIGFIVTLGTIMMRTNVDLISDDYYQQEVNYQAEIDAIRNGQGFENVTFQRKNNYLVAELPELMPTDVKIQLIRANDDLLDREYEIKGTRVLPIPMDELQAGEYEVKVTFDLEGKVHIQQQTITVQ